MFRVVFALIVVVSMPLRAERAESHETGPNPPVTCQAVGVCGNGGRAEQPLTELQLRYTTPVVNLFGKGLEDYIKTSYGSKIRDALVASKEGKNPQPLAEIYGDLFNRVDLKQMDVIRTEAKKMIEEETAKSTNRDDLRLELGKTLEAAVGVVKGGEAFVAKAEMMPFNKAFSAAYDKVFDSNDKKTYFEKLSQANAEPPNQEAQKWLRERGKHFLGWAADQAKNGFAESANKLLNGISWTNNGQKFVDMWGKANEAQRLFLGTSTDLLAQALTAFQNFAGVGFSHTSLASAQHPSPAKEWFYDPTKKAIEKGRPGGVNLPPPGGTPVPAAKGPDATKQAQATTPPPSTGGGNVDAVLASLKGLSCTGCHGGAFEKAGNTIVFKKDGKSFSAAETQAALDRISGMAMIRGTAAAAMAQWAALK